MGRKIRQVCSACGAAFNAEEKYVGKLVKCPQCKEPVNVVEGEAHQSSAILAAAPPKPKAVLDSGTATAAAPKPKPVAAAPAKPKAAAPSPKPVAAPALRYLNRLSDLLFVLARVENRRSGLGDEVWAGRKR